MQDRVRKQEDEADQQLWYDMGNEMSSRDKTPAFAELARNGDVIRGEKLQNLGAKDARQARPMRQRNSDDHCLRPAAEGEADHNQQHEMRQPHNHVDKHTDDGICPSSERDRGERQNQRNDRAGRRCNQADPETNARPLTVRANMSRPNASVPNQ